MSFLPIVERELRVRARLNSTYWLRTGGAGIAMLLVGFMLMVSDLGGTSPAVIGSGLFQTLAWPVFIFCMLEGVRTTADCLSEEKRNGTLGLLFLTDLKGYDVVVGKLIATSLNSFFMLLAVLPLMALPILMGGVMAVEFWRLVLVLVNAMFLSLAIGLCVSAVSRAEQRAMAGTLVMIVAVGAYPALAESWWFVPRLPAYFSPALGFATFDDATFQSMAGEFWISVACTHCLSWGLLGLASYLLPRTWQERTLNRGAGKWAGLRWPWMTPEKVRQRRAAMLAENPVLWLASRRLKGRGAIWLLTGLVVVIGFGCAIFIADNAGLSPANDALGFLVLGGIIFHLFLAFWVAALGSYGFAESRSSGALELLLVTPVPPTQIVEGYYQSLRRMFFKPVFWLVLTEFIVWICGITSLAFSWNVGGESVVGALYVLGLMVLFLTDLHAAAWYGLWMSASSKKPSQAMTKTSLFVFVLPYLFCGLPCNIIFPVIGILKNWIFIAFAKGQLHQRFHAEVTEQFSLQGQGTLLPAPQPPPTPPRMAVG
jgi:hypothetical protein